MVTSRGRNSFIISDLGPLEVALLPQFLLILGVVLLLHSGYLPCYKKSALVHNLFSAIFLVW